MYEFKRGIKNSAFIDALKIDYVNGGLWREIVNDKNLFIGIRNESINVYFKGNSLLRISFENNQLKAYTHFKYLVKNKIKSPYVSFNLNENIGLESELRAKYFYNEIKTINMLKRTSIPYAGLEKNGVQEIVKANNNIIDLEVALTQEADDREKDDQGNVEKEDPSNPRIDFAALKQKSTGIELQFFEAKHFSYTSVLRKRGKKDPKVIKQINDYEVLLKKYAPDIIKSYRTVCKNYCDLLPLSSISESIKAVNRGKKLSVCIEPRLVIFGFDRDQQNGAIWRPHIEKLNRLLPDRVLCKGNPEKFTTGIKE